MKRAIPAAATSHFGIDHFGLLCLLAAEAIQSGAVMADVAQPAGNPAGPRKVGLLLAIGIFLLPAFFVWLLLRKGYGPVARALGFGWTVVWFIAVAISPSDTATVNPSTAASGAPQISQQGREPDDAVPSAEAKAAFKVVQTSFFDAIRECNSGQNRLGRAVAAADRYAIFDAAGSEKQACMDAAGKISALSEPPPMSAKAAAALAVAFHSCGDDYSSFARAADETANAVNGDMAPSEFAEARQSNQVAQVMALDCTSKYAAAALDAKLVTATARGKPSVH